MTKLEKREVRELKGKKKKDIGKVQRWRISKYASQTHFLKMKALSKVCVREKLIENNQGRNLEHKTIEEEAKLPEVS